MRKGLWIAVAVLAVVQPVSAQDCAELEGRWPWGPASAVAVSGTVAVFSSGTVLEVVDVGDPAAPQVLGLTGLPSPAVDIHLADGLALVTAGADGLRVVDVSDPAAPAEVGSAILSGPARGLTRFEDVVLVAAGAAGLSLVDLSDPSAPVEIAVQPTPGEAVAVGVDLATLYAYVVDSEGHLLIVDVIAPAAPVVMSVVDDYLANPRDVAVAWPYLYVTDGNLAGMVWVFNVGDPNDPYYVGDAVFGVDDLPRSIAIAGDLAYVANDDRLHVMDLSSPAWPVQLGVTGTSGTAARVAVAGAWAYVAADGAGLQVVDVSAPVLPAGVAAIETPGTTDGVAVTGGLAALADRHDGLRVIDVSTPSEPVELGLCETPVEASRVVTADDLAFVADLASGLRIIDLATPSSPTEVGTYPTVGGATGLDVAGDSAYLIDPGIGLVVVDVASPSAAAHLATLPLLPGESGLDVAVTGDIGVVVADVDSDHLVVRVVDVSAPSAPAALGSLDLVGSPPSRVAIRGPRAYVVSATSGLTVVDISDPDHPVGMGTYDPPSTALVDLVISGTHALIADRLGKLHVVDVADPQSPHEVDVLETWGAVGIGARGGLAFVSTGATGLTVVDVGACITEIFADGFESGDTSAWSFTSPGRKGLTRRR